ncbi:MAG: hypothetical protein R3C20_10100 [Planctomycetaceae bacterium]
MTFREGILRVGFSIAVLATSSGRSNADLSSQLTDAVPGEHASATTVLDSAESGGPVVLNGARMTDKGFFSGQIGTYGGRNTGINNGYMSLEGRGGLFEDSGNEVFFFDNRLLLNDYTLPGGNLGLGYRQFRAGSNVVIGGNLFYDRWNLGQNAFNQIGLGAELLGDGWEARLNGYVPVGREDQQIGLANGFVVGTDIFATRHLQSALKGWDLEYGGALLSGNNRTLKAFGGTYYYDGTGVNGAFGLRGRGELAIGSSAALNLSVQNDSIFGTTAMFGATFTLPGRDIHDPGYRQSVYNRMTERVHRSQNVAVTEHTVTSNTGYNAFFVQQGASGSGTLADPGSLGALSSDPNFKAGDVAFLINSGGTFTDSFVIDAPGQQLIGSPDASGFATTTLPGNVILTQGGLGGRSTIDGQILFNTYGRASGFDISSASLIPIYVDGLAASQTIVVDSVNVNGSVDDGIHIVNSFGTFQFLAGTNGGLIQNVTGDGIEALGDVDVLLDNVTFNNVGMNAIRTNYTGTFVGTGNTVINNPGFNGIYLTNNDSTFQFENLTINGGGNGLFLDGFNGDFTVTGDAVFNKQVSTGIIQPSAAGVGNTSNLSFGNLTIDNHNGYAVSLENHTGSFKVTGDAVIESSQTLPVALGILSNNSSTDFSFGSLDIHHAGTALALINHSGNFTVDGQTSIDDYGILGIQSEGSTTNFNLGSLSVTNGGGTAVALINHTGEFNVTGATSVDDYAAFGFQVQGGATEFDLGSLNVSNGNGIAIALSGNNGNFIVHADANLSNNRGGGLLVAAGNSDISFGSLAVSHVPMQGYGVALEGHNGTFTVVGDADFNSTGQWGIQSRNSNTTFQFGSLDVIGTSIFGVALDHHTGDFTVDGAVNFTDPWQYGMLSNNSNSNIHFGSLSTSNTAQYAVALNSHTGDFIVDGAANLTNVGGYGVQVGPWTNGDVRFGSLNVTGASYVGLNVEGGTGSVLVQNGATIDGGNFGVQVNNRTGDVSFGSLTTSNNRYIGGVFQNINGNLNVTNDFIASNVGQGWYVDKAVQVSGTSGAVNFGSLVMDGNGALGLDYRFNQSGLTIAGTTANGGLSSTGFINGVQALDNTGDIRIGDVDVTGTGGFGTGLFVTRNNGSVLIDGDATFTNTGLNGASITNVTGAVEFGNLTVETTSQNGLFAQNISGDLTLGDVDMDNSGTFGIYLNNIGGNTSVENLDINGATSTGVGITNNNSSFTVTGTTNISNSHQGIAVTNSWSDLNFNDLTIENMTGNGLSLYNSRSNVNVTGNASFSNTGASAILSDGASSGNLQFNNLDVNTNWASGVSLNGHTGNFVVTNDATFTGAGGTSFLSQGNSRGDYSFSNLTTTGNWTNNVALVNHAGDFTVTGNTNFTGANIGLQVEGGTGDMTFADITINSPGTNGISVFGGNKNLTASGTTTITSPGANGLILTQGTGNINFSNLIVTDPGANGITMSLFDGRLTVSDGEISGIKSGQQAVFKHDSGSGTITLENMIFSTNANDVFGLVTLEYGNGGFATLNNNQAIFAQGSTGTIGYRFGSFGIADKVILSGTGNTTSNAVEQTLFDTFAPSFFGQVEIDGIGFPVTP